MTTEDDAAPSVEDLLVPIEHLGEGVFLDGVIDLSMPILREVLAVLDRHLEGVYVQAERSPDPFQFGELDRIDWFVGLGFTACQTYIAEMAEGHTLQGWKVAELRKRGPVHACGLHVVAIVHEVANHWKHGYEVKENTNRAAVLSSLLGRFNRWDGHHCYFALEQLLDPKLPRFEHLLPLLEQWRDSLPEGAPPIAPGAPS